MRFWPVYSLENELGLAVPFHTGATANKRPRFFGKLLGDLQEGYGYQALTQEDKAKIFGLNFARLIGIEPRKRVD